MYVGVPAYCIDPFPRSAYKINTVKHEKNYTTYNKFSKSKIADFNFETVSNQDIMTLDISMDDA